MPTTAEGPDAPAPEVLRSGRQTAVIAAGRVVAAGLSALWFVIAARQLTLGEFSDLALVLAVGSALYFLADAGYSPLLSVHVAQLGSIQPAALLDAIRRRLVGCILALVILVPGYLAASEDSSVVVPLVFFGSLAGNAVHGSITASFRALGHSTLEAMNEITSRALMVAAGWWVLHAGGGVVGAVAVFSGVDLLSAVVLGLVAVQWCRRNPSPPLPLPNLGWRATVPITVGSGFSTIYGRLDSWLVGLLGAGGSVGLYAAAYRITDSVRLPAHAAGAVLLADAQRAGKEGPALARRRACRYAAVMVLPGILLVVVAEPLMRTLFGTDFAVAAPVLRILALSVVASAVVSVLGPFVAVRGGNRFAISVGAVTSVNLVANFLLIPHLGAAGAAWANLLSESVLACLFLWVISDGGGRERDPGPKRP